MEKLDFNFPVRLPQMSIVLHDRLPDDTAWIMGPFSDETPDDQVVAAALDGRKVTAAEARKIMKRENLL